jgi:CubicO group peptidase (beta-lactamase class C family)
VIRPDLTDPRRDSADLEDAVDALFGRPAEEGHTYALVVQQGGETLVERYGTQPGNLFHPDPVEVRADTPLVSWSVAKSMVHAAVGVLALEGRVDLTVPVAIPEWRGTDKEAITLLDLLEMRSGLRFAEEYVDAEHSDCIAMLFGEGSDDHAAFAAALPLEHPIGMVWNYSSGSTNIICRVLGDLLGDGEAESREQRMREFLDERLFGPVGMASADPRFDRAGTWVGSSYVYATATDELYLRDGVVGGERILPEGWAAHARTRVAEEPDSGFGYGRHWWLWPDLPGSLAAHGYDGQYVIVVPGQDAVIVHLGKTDAAVRPLLTEHLRRVIRCL